MDSAIYVGKLRHRRFEPVGHEFSYPVFMAFLDIDALPELMKASRFSSYNRWNWTSYYERDHFGDARETLRMRLQKDAAKQGLQLPNGQIFMLTHLRYFGYVFNPVSFYYCCERDGRLAMILSEVNNTFGESKNYWLTADNELPNSKGKQYQTAKELHVSPFQPMELEYRWVFSEPGDQILAHMKTLDNGKANFDATLQLERRPWQAKEIVRTLAAYPFMTLRVIAGIHWQALRLWLKGVPVHTHPAKIAAAQAARAAKGDVLG